MTPLPALPDDRTTAPLSPEERDALRTKVSRWISAMCNGDARWRMCVPVDPDDSDVMLSTLVEDHARLEADHARLTVALQAATEDSARLDWLQANRREAITMPNPDAEGGESHVANAWGLYAACETVREAVDTGRRSLPTEDTKR